MAVSPRFSPTSLASLSTERLGRKARRLRRAYPRLARAGRVALANQAVAVALLCDRILAGRIRRSQDLLNGLRCADRPFAGVRVPDAAEDPREDLADELEVVPVEGVDFAAREVVL